MPGEKRMKVGMSGRMIIQRRDVHSEVASTGSGKRGARANGGRGRVIIVG